MLHTYIWLRDRAQYRHIVLVLGWNIAMFLAYEPHHIYLVYKYYNNITLRESTETLECLYTSIYLSICLRLSSETTPNTRCTYCKHAKRIARANCQTRAKAHKWCDWGAPKPFAKAAQNFPDAANRHPHSTSSCVWVDRKIAWLYTRSNVHVSVSISVGFKYLDMVGGLSRFGLMLGEFGVVMSPFMQFESGFKAVQCICTLCNIL